MEEQMSVIHLLDDSLSVEIYHEGCDKEYKDNICVRIIESCPAEERLLRFEETNLFLTAVQAEALMKALQVALKQAMDCQS